MEDVTKTIKYDRILKSEIRADLKKQLKVFKALKWYMCVSIEFVKDDITKTSYFHTGTYTLCNSGQIDKQYKQGIVKIIKLIMKWTHQGSGWVFKDVEEVMMRMIKYKPF